jgi:competence protein ComEA
MRSRDREQDWIEELGRRRLEALVAELTAPPDPGEPSHATEVVDEPGPRRTSDDREPQDVPAGRHARRPLAARDRATGWLGDRLPESVRSRGGLSQGHVGVLALLLAVALLLGGWAWLRSGGTTTAPVAAPRVTAPAGSPSASGLPLPSPGSSTTAVGAVGASPPASGAAEVVVHVAGRVRRPGIVVLPTGSRVVDAVRRAGGFAPGVGPRSAALNLARVLVDGEQIVVGQPGGASAGASTGAPTAAGGATPMVSLNTADEAGLESLPGVGPVTAAAILQWRTEHGPFTAVEQLLEVSGIGEATLAQIEPHVTL